MSESHDALLLNASASTAKPEKMADHKLFLDEPVDESALPESGVAAKLLSKRIGGINAA